MAAATNIYKRVLGLDSGEPRAIKGLMQVADAMVEHNETVQTAVEIYEFLLATSGSSRLAEDMRRGHEEARRKLARIHAPVG